MSLFIEPKLSTLKDLKEWLTKIHEKYYIELKKASELPNAFWESYSSFCNTSGGWIILGVIEGNPQNEIRGVDNAEKAIVSLWDQLSNRNKVSFKNVDNSDVNVYDIDGKKVIIVHIKEAPEGMKPVYLNGKLENTWIRTGDGDRRATSEDLDLDSVITYKERVSKRYPKKNYIGMPSEDFLREIGACAIDRNTGELKIKKEHSFFLER